MYNSLSKILALEGKAGLLSTGPYSLALDSFCSKASFPALKLGLCSVSVGFVECLSVVISPHPPYTPPYSMVSLGDCISSVSLEDEGPRLE